MKLRLRSAASCVAAVAMAATGLTALAAPASADAIGTMTFTPTSGGVQDQISLATSGGCPADAPYFSVDIRGGAFPEVTPINGAATLASAGSAAGDGLPITVDFSKTLLSAAQDAGLQALTAGTYTVTLKCRTALNPTSKGDYVGALYLTSPTAWQSTEPVLAPGVTTAPTVVGTKRVGFRQTCSGASFSNSPTSLAYSWLRAGSVIPGANASTYTLAAVDYRRGVACRVTATNAGGSTSATSPATVTVLGLPLRATVRASVRGVPAVNRVVTAGVGRWTPAAASYSYSWRLSGKVIRGATKSALKLRPAFKGAYLTVVVTAKRAGYAAGVSTSARVRVR